DSPPELDQTEDGDAARLPAPAGASIRFQPGGVLRVWPDTRPIRWSGSSGGTCLGLSRVPFRLPLINHFHAERMRRSTREAMPKVCFSFANLLVHWVDGIFSFLKKRFGSQASLLGH